MSFGPSPSIHKFLWFSKCLQDQKVAHKRFLAMEMVSIAVKFVDIFLVHQQYSLVFAGIMVGLCCYHLWNGL